MAPDVALNPKQLANYPFARLSGPANVLVMPGLQSANISAKLLRELGGDADARTLAAVGFAVFRASTATWLTEGGSLPELVERGFGVLD